MPDSTLQRQVRGDTPHQVAVGHDWPTATIAV